MAALRRREKQIGVLLKKLYTNPNVAGSFQSPERLFQAAKKQPQLTGVTMRDVERWMSGQDSYTMHKEARRGFKTSQVVVEGLNALWEIDLADLSSYALTNGGVKYIFTAIDVFSRQLKMVPLKDKSVKTVVQALRKVLNSDAASPSAIRSDMGGEFVGHDFREELRSRDIHQYFSHGDSQCPFVERVIRTMKMRIRKLMEERGENKYVDNLSELVSSYNATAHSALGVAPHKVKRSNESEMRYNQYLLRERREKGKVHKNNAVKPVFRYAVGVPVRLSKRREKLRRHYDTKWTTEVFFISAQRMRDRIPVYTVRDSTGEVLDGSFYERELQQVVLPGPDKMYEIERIVSEKIVGGKKMVKVRWRGFPAKFDTFIPSSRLKTLQKQK